ncbi:MAG: ligand-binding sensor domain-containing protein, partial [Sphingobacteriaceae bacterium]
MFKKRVCIICCFLLLVVFRSLGQAYYFDHLDIAHGLSNNAVLCSVQDKNGFLWFGTKDGLNRYDGYTFKQYFSDSELNNGLASNYITCLLVDESNNLWVGTDRGLYRFDPSTENFQVVQGTETREIVAIEQDQHGVLWWIADYRLFSLTNNENSLVAEASGYVSTMTALGKNNHGEVFGASHKALFDLERKIEIPFPLDPQTNWHVECLTFDNHDHLWMGTQHQGLIRARIDHQSFEKIGTPLDQETNLYVRDIERGVDDQLWVATESGLILLHIHDLSQVFFQYERDNPWSLSDNAVYCATVDHQGGVWVGSFFGGINYFHHKHNLFERIFPRDAPGSISGRAVREMRMDQQQNLWIGTEDNGLNFWDRSKNKFTHFSTENGLSHNNIHGLELVGDSLLVGTFNSGLDIIDTRSKKIIAHYDRENTAGDLGSDFVMNILRTRKGRIFINTPGGLYDFSPGVDRFQKLSFVPDSIFYTSGFEDRKGHLWLTTWRDGVYRIDGETNEVVVFQHDPSDPTSLNSNRTNRIEQDSRGNIWIATENGLAVWDERGRPIKRFTKNDGLPSNLILAFAEDEHQNMWVSTSYGLVSVGVADYQIRVYNKEYGLSNLQFNYNSVLKSPSGMLYFGSISGLIRFHPDSILTRGQAAMVPIYLTSARSSERGLILRDSFPNNQYSEPIYSTLLLDHDESTVHIEFAALNFVDAASTTYHYRLEGFDEQWTQTVHNSAYYTKLPPGDYDLRVKAMDAQGRIITKEISLPIRVNKPWWFSGAALLIYCLLFLMIGYAMFRYFYSRIKETNRRKIQDFNADRERRLYQAKLDFFSQVAHDIKTPLTLIKGPLEKLIGSQQMSEQRSKRLLQTMSKNTDKLVGLTNSILDFRKIEVGENSLKRERMDISRFVEDFVKDYAPSFQLENKNLSTTIDSGIRGQGDIDVLTKILENLLSNALKYAD